MKTNHTARQIVRLRPFLSFLAVVAILGADLGLGGSMAWRMEQASSTRTPTQAASMNVSVGDWVASAR